MDNVIPIQSVIQFFITAKISVWHKQFKYEEKQPESMETVGFSDCFEIGLDGGKEYL